MEPHEWANHITREADHDIRTLEGIIGALERIRELGRQFRTVAVMQGETSRLVDDASVEMSRTSRELESIRSKVDSYYEKLRDALTM